MLRRLTRQIMEAQYGAAGPINQSRPVADPQNQTAASLLSFNNTARIVFGCITGVSAVANCYRVYYEKAKAPGIAVLTPLTTCAASGPRDLRTLQPGTMVICIVHDQIPYSFIIGVLPPVNTQSTTANASVLFSASRARVDELHKKPLRMPGAGGMSDMLAGRPFDATMAGETGWIAETGTRIFMDSWMATLGVDEMCAVTAFYHDQLLRLAAYNYQHWTACVERESMNDQGECLDWTGNAVYPWEQLGGFFPGVDPLRVKTPEEWQLTQPWYGKVEPADDWRMPWHRSRTFMGYLGQGGKHSLQSPPIHAESQDYASYAKTADATAPVYPGLLDISQTLDGRLLVQSAKGIHVAKRAAIISPVRMRRPEQPGGLGDDPTNYKFSGINGAGAAQPITGNIAIPAADKPLSRAAGLLDVHSYFFNYAAIQPFFHHAKDYAVPEESELSHTEGQSVATPPFSTLAAEQYLNTEAFKRGWRVDHRYGTSDYYALGCGYDLLDDGGVVHYGGCGEEIKFIAGNIILSCPGDIWLKSGRNVIQWAGWDSITRAQNSADVTVTAGDIRHKAERNYHVISGNSGEGGTLLENRAAAEGYDFDNFGEATVSSGIILKSRHAPLVTWSAGVYIRTGGGNVDSGAIYLDADVSDIITKSYHCVSFITGARRHHFGSAGNVNQSNSFTETATVICAQTSVNGRLDVAGEISARGNIMAAGGTIITEGAQTDPIVIPLEDPLLAEVYRRTTEAQENSGPFLTRTGEEYWLTLEENYYAEDKAGNDETITKAEFSLRQLADYRTQDFRVYEDRWQQLGRLSGDTTSRWTETPVLCQGTPTYPYPGREKFETPTLFQQDLTMFDAARGRANDRGQQPDLNPEYATPTLGDPVGVALSNYRIVRTKVRSVPRG
jgi:hypothetical protein